MNTKWIIAALGLTIIVAACKKDSFETKPRIKIISITPDNVNKGELIKLTASFTDKEGDIADSILITQKLYEGTMLVDSFVDDYSLKALNIPKGTKEGELLIQYIYG